MTLPQNPPPSARPLSRELYLRLSGIAAQQGYTRFARQICLSWLAAFPGDLPASLMYAQLLQSEGHAEHALPILTRLCQTDPEDLGAAQTRHQAVQKVTSQAKGRPTGRSRSNHRPQVTANEALSAVLALGDPMSPDSHSKSGAPIQEDTLTLWSQQVRQARLLLEKNSDNLGDSTGLDKAEESLRPALANIQATALVGITHLRLLKAKGAPKESLRTLAEFYRKHWPDCLQFDLFLAEALIEIGQAGEAVSLLHKAAARDITGQVAERLWGVNHAYRALWPERIELTLDIPIPASIAAAMGWNQLPVGTLIQAEEVDEIEVPVDRINPKGMPELPPQIDISQVDFSKEDPEIPETLPRPVFSALPETLRSVQAELERVAERLHKPELARSDGRYPVYVVMTTRRGLANQYGAKAELLHEELRNLVKAVQSRRDWRAILFYADEGLPPNVRAARPSDPWSLKLSLVDLDAHLRRRGEMIGAVLIVGGPDVVPFHRLPNPVDDVDDDVPSDNPYATRDENYFIPEWPVGRLPAGSSEDPSLLGAMIKTLADRHTAVAGRKRRTRRNWLVTLFDWLFRRLGPSTGSKHKMPSFGYSAAIWKQTSQMVFRPIGESRALRISPPLAASGLGSSPLPSGRLAYFNLHGLVDAVEWYGQSEIGNIKTEETEGLNSSMADPIEYPVALRPQDIINSGHAPEVVFSEACYGAHILGKRIEEALALKFLQAGSQAVAGSTCTAYGSINTPLTAADFLGHAFWNELKQGSSAGEALRRAKVSLAREMHHRQGYLDGEDQKTLISFVLYGDPLAQPLGNPIQPKGMSHPAVIRSLKPPRGVKTICDRARQEDIENPVPGEVIEYVKGIVEQYLPGMKDAQVSLSHEHSNCIMAGHECPTGQLHLKPSGKNVVMLEGSTPPVTEDTLTSRRIIVLSKEVNGSAHLHRHYARLTLDEQNHLVKLVVSR